MKLRSKLLLFSVLTEASLRSFLGFCNSPLCVESESYEYVRAPNQDVHRFGYHIHYNSFSQRSEEPDSTKKIILGLGDSVLNGGAHTDQSELATTLFTNETGIQMLNISCGSWGPDNLAAYLKEKGLFGASGMVVVLSSHDAHDIMDFKPVVGVSPAYPKEQYSLAIWELIDRYIIFRIKKKLNILANNDPDAAVNAANGIRKDNGEGFNPGWEQLKEIAESANIPIAIYLHPEKSEIKSGKYNELTSKFDILPRRLNMFTFACHI